MHNIGLKWLMKSFFLISQLKHMLWVLKNTCLNVNMKKSTILHSKILHTRVYALHWSKMVKESKSRGRIT